MHGRTFVEALCFVEKARRRKSAERGFTPSRLLSFVVGSCPLLDGHDCGVAPLATDDDCQLDIASPFQFGSEQNHDLLKAGERARRSGVLDGQIVSPPVARVRFDRN